MFHQSHYILFYTLSYEQCILLHMMSDKNNFIWKMTWWFCAVEVQDLNVGWSIVSAAITDVTGTQKTKIKEMYNTMGDLGTMRYFANSYAYLKRSSCIVMKWWHLACQVMLHRCVVRHNLYLLHHKLLPSNKFTQHSYRLGYCNYCWIF